ncbi:hypothetical protein AB0G74_16465 [Streptomyces sp. NPDC020875]|uniref:hypothetical protein n=1 Tax=Streptomyces sp. NPDC020875 TaxID=3154898 RepID=UPI0034033C02
MYLVHAELRQEADAVLPGHADQLITDCADSDDGLEHIVVHPQAADGTLVGLFMLASTVEEAELRAARVCRRALETQPELEGFALLGCGVRLVPGLHDQLLHEDPDGQDMPRHD